MDSSQQSKDAEETRPPGSGWTFLTNHAHVLICLVREPNLRLRDVAERVGITERGVHRIVNDLEEAGVLTRNRDGRRNHYQVDTSQHLRHPIEAHCTIRQLLEIVNTTPQISGSDPAQRAEDSVDAPRQEDERHELD